MSLLSCICMVFHRFLLWRLGYEKHFTLTDIRDYRSWLFFRICYDPF